MPQNDGIKQYPLNSAGRPQHAVFGHCVKGRQLRPQSVTSIIDEKNRLRRSLRALTAGIERLEWAAEKVADMRMSRPDLAVLHCRRVAFDDRFRDLPFCEIEKDMIDIGQNAMVVLFSYQTVKRAIERQLNALAAVRNTSPVPVDSAA